MSIPSPRPAAVRRASFVAAGLLLLGSLAAPAVFAAGSTIRIGDGLDPVELRIRPGTTVTFRNNDGQRHRLRSRAGARFDTGNIEPGEARSIRFTVTGHYPYVDERARDAMQYHGTIVVTASGGAGSSAGSAAEGSTGAAGTPGGAAPASATIHFAGRRFSPSSITVRAGATITFRNDDDREHTASATLGAFETGVLPPGVSGRVKLASPGTHRYVCLIHPDMTGTITVAAASGGAHPAPPTSAPTTGPTSAPTTVPTTPPATTPTPDPTPETTPGPTILEAGIGAAGPPDGPATTADAMAATGLDTAYAGRLLLVVLVTGAAIVTFARLVAGTGRRRDAPTVSRDPG